MFRLYEGSRFICSYSVQVDAIRMARFFTGKGKVIIIRKWNDDSIISF